LRYHDEVKGQERGRNDSELSRNRYKF